MRKQSFKNFNRFQKVLSVFLIFSFLFLNPIYEKVLAQPNIVEEGRNIIKNSYVNTVPDYVLNAPNLNEMIERLKDPYSEYFTKEEYEEFVNSVNNKFCGIGIGIEMVPEGIKVARIIEDSPALEVGIKAGDIIVQADEYSLAGLSDSEAASYIKGEEGSVVKVKVLRDKESLNFTVERREIKIPTVKSGIISGKTAYILISSFGQDTGDLFSAAVKEMDSLGADSYIIDLRYNGGGYMGTALDIAGHFIGSSPAITVEDRDLVQYKFKAIAHEKLINKPVIFLINEYSASASEILAAAVKDYNKALFIGSTTYGKGVAQQMFPLSDGSFLKLTVEKFYSPLGKTIHKVGVSPDFKVDDKEVDSLKVASLLLSKESLPKNKTGYMRIDMDGREFYIDLTMARHEDYWNTYNYIINKSSTENIYRGTAEGWQKSSKAELDNKTNEYFLDYKVLPELKKDINVDKYFNVKFNMPIDMESLNSGGIEIISENTGKRIPAKFEDLDNRILVTPLESLEKGQSYYLVVNPSVKAKNGKKIKQGTVIKYMVP